MSPSEGRRFSTAWSLSGPAARFVAVNVVAFLTAKVVIAAATYYLPSWDESVYVGIGKYLYSGGKSGLFEAIRPPGVPLLTGALWRVGLDPLQSARIASLALAATASVLSYVLASRLYSRLSGAIAAFLLLWAPLFFTESDQIMTEIPSSVFVVLSLCLLLKRADVLAGVAAGTAILVRFPQGIFALTAGGLGVVSLFVARAPVQRRGLLAQTVRFGIGVSAVMAFYLVSNVLVYRPYVDSWWRAAIRPITLAGAHSNNPFETMTGHAGPVVALFTYWVRLGLTSPALAVGLLGGLILAFVALVRHRAEVPSLCVDRRTQVSCLLLTFLALAVAFLASIPNTQERFLIPLLPAIAVVAGGAFGRVVEWYLASRKTTQQSTPSGSRPVGLHRIRHLAAAAVVALLAASAIASAVGVYHDYRNRPARGPIPPVVAFYQRIDRLVTLADGPIVTGQPQFAAYTDHALVPFYEDIDPRTVFINDWDTWESSVAKASLVFYAPFSYQCLPGMAWCAGREAELRARVFALGPVVDAFCPSGSADCRYYVVRPAR